MSMSTSTGTNNQTTSTFDEDPALLKDTLEFLVSSLPRYELELMLEDADDVEKVLEAEIALLEAKRKGLHAEKSSVVTQKRYIDKVMTVHEMQQSFETPLDKYGITLSSLIGRLRSPLETIHPPHSTLPHHVAARLNASNQLSAVATNKAVTDEATIKSILDLKIQPCYTQTVTTHALLTLWKRISSHRSATVFRRPVQDREAPGYSKKILFPVDLSLVRKMIVSNIITTYAELHRYIGILAHNCVKFNGRESDYGVVAREFEGFVDESIVLAVANATEIAIKTGKLATPPEGTKNQEGSVGATKVDSTNKTGSDNVNMPNETEKADSLSNTITRPKAGLSIDNIESGDSKLNQNEKGIKSSPTNTDKDNTLSETNDLELESTSQKVDAKNGAALPDENISKEDDETSKKARNNSDVSNIDKEESQDEDKQENEKEVNTDKKENDSKDCSSASEVDSESRTESQNSPRASSQKRKRSQVAETSPEEEATTTPSQGPIRRSKRSR